MVQTSGDPYQKQPGKDRLPAELTFPCVQLKEEK
ncbi:unnamed protein product, partial [marine sediment metagenome]